MIKQNKNKSFVNKSTDYLTSKCKGYCKECKEKRLCKLLFLNQQQTYGLLSHHKPKDNYHSPNNSPK